MSKSSAVAMLLIEAAKASFLLTREHQRLQIHNQLLFIDIFGFLMHQYSTILLVNIS